jgi:hypothetical protein
VQHFSAEHIRIEKENNYKMLRTRLFKAVRGAAGISLLAGGMGVIGAVGFGLATGSTVAGATTPTFSLACGYKAGVAGVDTTATNAIPVIDELTATADVTGTLAPSPVTGGATVTLSGTTLPVTIPHKLLEATTPGTHVKVKVHITGVTSGATPTAYSLTGVATVTLRTVTHVTYVTPTTGKPAAAPTGTALNETGTFGATGDYSKVGLKITVTLTPSPAAFTADPTGTVSVGIAVSHATKKTAASSLTITLAGTTVGTFGCSNPAETITTDSITVAALAVTTTSPLPSGTVGVHYSDTLTAKGGTGGDTWSATGLATGLTISSTGKISGTPTKAGTFTVKATVMDSASVTASATLALTIKAATGIPPVRQPISETVLPGVLTLSCTHSAAANATAVTTCPLITLPPITLNQKTQKVENLMNTIYVSTARGGATDDWTLTAQMVTTSSSLNTNASCATFADFCNATVGAAAARKTSNGLYNGQIPAADLALGHWSCIPSKGKTTPKYKTTTFANTNPAPSTGFDGGTFAGTITLCTAVAGQSGGLFMVGSVYSTVTGHIEPTTPAGFQLTIPSTVYAGTYYGTVQYTVVGSV